MYLIPKQMKEDWIKFLSLENASMEEGTIFCNFKSGPCFCAVGSFGMLDPALINGSVLFKDSQIKRLIGERYSVDMELDKLFELHYFKLDSDMFEKECGRERNVLEQAEYLFEELGYTREQIINWIEENVEGV